MKMIQDLEAGLKKSYRIKREKDFSAIFNRGKNYANRRFVLYKREQEAEGSHFRVGLSVSKKLGNAVVRNTIKRRLRHVLHNHRSSLAPVDFVVIARKGVEALDYHEIEKNLLHLLRLAEIHLSPEKDSL